MAKENARPIEVETSATGNGVSILAQLPARHNTVTAEVLARLLRYERLTGLDGVYEASTTRLAAVVEYLESSYGWTIDRDDKVTGCNDGRVAWVKEYYLPPTTATAAMERGAADWCLKVWKARAALRTKAAEAKRQAERINQALRQKRQPPEQGALFGGVNG